MRKVNNIVYFLVCILFFSLVNFYFSNLLASMLISGEKYTMGLVDLVYVKNTGAAFSILQNSTTLLSILSFLAVIFIVYYIIRNIDEKFLKEIFFLSVLLSGILGNLYERVMFGYVRDFFSLNFINFPIFNISDIFINIGVFGIAVLILLTKRPVKL